MNYEFNLLHHVGVVAKRVRAPAVAVETAAAHEGDDNANRLANPKTLQIYQF